MNQGCLSAGNDGSEVPTRIQEMNMFEDILGILQTNWTRVIIPPKCEMHLNATLMSPNLGNKKIVYRQNITDTSNIYIDIYVYTYIVGSYIQSCYEAEVGHPEPQFPGMMYAYASL